MKATAGRTITGLAGTATEVIVEMPDDDGSRADTGTYFLVCPGQTPLNDKFILSSVHLRDTPGSPPAILQFPEATHEIILFMLDPTKNPTLDPTSWGALRPLNFVGQVQVPDDEAAKTLLDLLAKAVVDGILWAEPPLSGQTEPWATIVANTAAHTRGEHD